MAVIHISEADAEGTFKVMLGMVRSGERVHIAIGSETVAVVHPVTEKSEEKGLPSAIRWAQEQNSDIVLDDKFSEDLDQLIFQNTGVRPRRASEILADLERSGCKALLPEGFADAVEDGIRSHQNEQLGDRWESF